MDSDEAHQRLLRRRSVLLRFATRTRVDTLSMKGELDPANPVSQALAEIDDSCRRLIQILESPVFASHPKVSPDD